MISISTLLLLYELQLFSFLTTVININLTETKIDLIADWKLNQKWLQESILVP